MARCRRLLDGGMLDATTWSTGHGARGVSLCHGRYLCPCVERIPVRCRSPCGNPGSRGPVAQPFLPYSH